MNSCRSWPVKRSRSRNGITLRDRDRQSSLTIHVCFLHETQFVRTNNANMEEAGILEKISCSGFCYPALNQKNQPIRRISRRDRIMDVDVRNIVIGGSVMQTPEDMGVWRETAHQWDARCPAAGPALRSGPYAEHVRPHPVGRPGERRGQFAHIETVGKRSFMRSCPHPAHGWCLCRTQRDRGKPARNASRNVPPSP